MAESGLCEREICHWEPRAVDSGAAISRKYKNGRKRRYFYWGVIFGHLEREGARGEVYRWERGGFFRHKNQRASIPKGRIMRLY